MEVKHTPGPWNWRDVAGELTLLSLTDMHPYVLNVGKSATGDNDRPVLRMRDSKRDLMVAATVDHPDARLIAAAPDLIRACQAVAVFCDCEEAADWKDAISRLTSLCADAVAKAKVGAK